MCVPTCIVRVSPPKQCQGPWSLLLQAGSSAPASLLRRPGTARRSTTGYRAQEFRKTWWLHTLLNQKPALTTNCVKPTKMASGVKSPHQYTRRLADSPSWDIRCVARKAHLACSRSGEEKCIHDNMVLLEIACSCQVQVLMAGRVTK